VAVIKTRWIIGLVVVGLVALHVGPLLVTHSEQDSCSFGNVSNAEYRSLLLRAKMGFWRPFAWNDDAVSTQLSTKYQELVPEPSTAADKVAAAHAVLRALGAELQRFDDFHNPNRDAKVQRTFAYRYLLDINRLFYFAPVFRKMMVTVIIDAPFVPTTNGAAGRDPPIAAHFPNALEGFYHFERNLGQQACPPVPTA
jgi:hypothetical protein